MLRSIYAAPMATELEDNLESALGELAELDQPFTRQQVYDLSEGKALARKDVDRVIDQLIEGGVLRENPDGSLE